MLCDFEGDACGLDYSGGDDKGRWTIERADWLDKAAKPSVDVTTSTRQFSSIRL